MKDLGITVHVKNQSGNVFTCSLGSCPDSIVSAFLAFTLCLELSVSMMQARHVIFMILASKT